MTITPRTLDAVLTSHWETNVRTFHEKALLWNTASLIRRDDSDIATSFLS